MHSWYTTKFLDDILYLQSLSSSLFFHCSSKQAPLSLPAKKCDWPKAGQGLGTRLCWGRFCIICLGSLAEIICCDVPWNEIPRTSYFHSQYSVLLTSRVSYGGVGALKLSPPCQNFWEIEYGYYYGAINISYLILHVSMCHQNVVWKVCPRLRQKQSERI